MDNKQLDTLLNKKRKQAQAYRQLRKVYPELARATKRNIESINKQIRLLKLGKGLLLSS